MSAPDLTPEAETALTFPVTGDTGVQPEAPEPETETLEALPAQASFAGASDVGLMEPAVTETLPADAEDTSDAESLEPLPPEGADWRPRAFIFEAAGTAGIFPCFHCKAEYTDPAAAGQDRYLDSLRMSAVHAGWDSDSLGEWSCPACLPAHIASPAALVPVSPDYRLMYDAYRAAGRYEDIDAMFDAPERHAVLGFDKAARHATSALAGARREIAILAAEYQHARETGEAA